MLGQKKVNFKAELENIRVGVELLGCGERKG